MTNDELAARLRQYAHTMRRAAPDDESDVALTIEQAARRLEAAGRMEDALCEIQKGVGRFDRDPMKHAENTIDNMRGLAIDALAAWRETL